MSRRVIAELEVPGRAMLVAEGADASAFTIAVRVPAEKPPADLVGAEVLVDGLPIGELVAPPRVDPQPFYTDDVAPAAMLVDGPTRLSVILNLYSVVEVEEAREQERHANAAAYDLVEALVEVLRDEELEVTPIVDRDDLARQVLEALDKQRERTNVDEWDESDSRCELYNLAYAILEEGRQP